MEGYSRCDTAIEVSIASAPKIRWRPEMLNAVLVAAVNVGLLVAVS